MCTYSETPVDAETGHCADDWHAHCPLCGTASIDKCVHLLAAEKVPDADDGWNTAPFGKLPPLRKQCDCAWTADHLRLVFGEAYPLLAMRTDYGKPQTSTACSRYCLRR